MAQEQRSVEQNRQPRYKPKHMINEYMKKEPSVDTGEKTVSSVTGTGKTKQLHAGE